MSIVEKEKISLSCCYVRACAFTKFLFGRYYPSAITLSCLFASILLGLLNITNISRFIITLKRLLYSNFVAAKQRTYNLHQYELACNIRTLNN